MRAKEKHKARKDIGSWGRTLAGMARKRLKDPRKCAGHSMYRALWTNWRKHKKASMGQRGVRGKSRSLNR